MVCQYTMDDLLYLMARLRDAEDGCPWDREQDFATIAPYTIEESYELADAIYNKDFQQIKEELGDVLFQVVFYAQLGKEQGQFDFFSIVSTLVDKLIRRHPHVFPDGTLTSRVGQQTATMSVIKNNWETTKTAERHNKHLTGVLDDVPIALPALGRAMKLQKRASQVGFDWDNIDDVLQRLRDELDELLEARQQQSSNHVEEELGDVLFCAVNLARHLNVEPEAALGRANRKFEGRFRYIEQVLSARGSSPREASLDIMDTLWDEAKQQGL